MDSIFLLQGEARASFLQTIGRVLRCTYICLWCYVPSPNNCLVCMDGWDNVDNDKPSSSSGSLPQSLFKAYRQSLYSIENGCVPGFAFKRGLPCLQLHEPDLLTWASTENQRQFYQEARIKIAMFMGCRSGEIELGSSMLNNSNMQMDQIRNLFTGDFIQQYLSSESSPLNQSQTSLSTPLSLIDADYLYPFLHDMPGSTARYMPDPFKEASSYQLTEPTPLVIPPHQLAMQAHAQSHNIRLPTPASDDAAMTRAMLAVLSSRSSFSSSYGTQQTQTFQHQISDGTGAFKPYDPALDPMTGTRSTSHGQYWMKLMFSILRSINSASCEPWMPETQQKSSRLQHIIVERKRRETISKGIQELICLLPHVSKKDKISVLSNTREYLHFLKAQVIELKYKKRMLENQVSPAKEDHDDSDTQMERVVLRAVEASSKSSSSEERQIELRVRVRKEDCDMVVLVHHILQFLKQMKDMSIVSMEADTLLHHMNRWNRAILRLKIKSSAWNEESFKATMKQAVADVAR